MSNSAHWLKPCRHKALTGRHALLYVEEKLKGSKIVPGYRRLWSVDAIAAGWQVRKVSNWSTTDQLDEALGKVCLPRGETTLWVLRGWTDLVLSGLVELMDAGVITWRYVSFSGRTCLVKGLWRGRAITITSLPNWSGNRWDSWGDCSRDNIVAEMMTALEDYRSDGTLVTGSEEDQSISVLAAIISTCSILHLPRVPPTAGAAGLLLWRTWLGPRVKIIGKGRTKKAKQSYDKGVTYVGPIPSRPVKAANAERHTCYSLTNRQLRTGLVQGPIYCADLRSAYLLGLSRTPLPIVFDKTLHKPKIEELAEKLQLHTGCALVRIQCDDWYYPCRLNGRVSQCKGRFWAWLAGAELVHALCSGHISECWTAYTWRANFMPDDERMALDTIKSACEHYGLHCIAAAWRSVYSALIGRFAGWQRVWRDSPAYAGFGRWAQWLQAAHTGGMVVPHRSVAGKVQYLAEKTDKLDSVPLLFGCVTSMVRWLVQSICLQAGYDNIVSIAADSVWLNTAGWQKLQLQMSKCGLAPDNLKVKSIYDKAWMSGGSVVVTERHGVRELHIPGVSSGSALDSNGQVVVEHADDWDSDGEPKASKGIRRRRHRYTATKVVEKYSYPARVIPPGEEVSIPLLDHALLREIKGQRTVEDA